MDGGGKVLPKAKKELATLPHNTMAQDSTSLVRTAQRSF